VNENNETTINNHKTVVNNKSFNLYDEQNYNITKNVQVSQTFHNHHNHNDEQHYLIKKEIHINKPTHYYNEDHNYLTKKETHLKKTTAYNFTEDTNYLLKKETYINKPTYSYNEENNYMTKKEIHKKSVNNSYTQDEIHNVKKTTLNNINNISKNNNIINNDIIQFFDLKKFKHNHFYNFENNENYHYVTNRKHINKKQFSVSEEHILQNVNKQYVTNNTTNHQKYEQYHKYDYYYYMPIKSEVISNIQNQISQLNILYAALADFVYNRGTNGENPVADI
jgi:hypothetical protein